MRKQRDFLKRSPSERAWFTQNTWCDKCGKPDLNLVNPHEYKENETVFIEGKCSRCGTVVKTKIKDSAL